MPAGFGTQARRGRSDGQYSYPYLQLQDVALQWHQTEDGQRDEGRVSRGEPATQREAVEARPARLYAVSRPGCSMPGSYAALVWLFVSQAYSSTVLSTPAASKVRLSRRMQT